MLVLSKILFHLKSIKFAIFMLVVKYSLVYSSATKLRKIQEKLELFNCLCFGSFICDDINSSCDSTDELTL